jgi:hypothetical protein
MIFSAFIEVIMHCLYISKIESTNNCILEQFYNNYLVKNKQFSKNYLLTVFSIHFFMQIQKTLSYFFVKIDFTYLNRIIYLIQSLQENIITFDNTRLCSPFYFLISPPKLNSDVE